MSSTRTIVLIISAPIAKSEKLHFDWLGLASVAQFQKLDRGQNHGFFRFLIYATSGTDWPD